MMELHIPLICPVCGGPLADAEDGRALVCGAGHLFDIAAAGYCNLLRPGKLRNRTSGDDRGMVAARTRFLSTGAYGPFAERVSEIVKNLIPDGGLIIDAGCGEGYYTNKIAASCGCCALGVDVSKHAAAAASRASSREGIADRVRYIVASSASLPVADGCADVVLSIFSPCCYGEFARVTKEGGYLVACSAGEEHLKELKAVLYGEGNVRPNVPIDHASLSAQHGFEICAENCEKVKFTADISGQDNISALFSMTPYRWRTPKAGTDALADTETITVTVDVDITVLRLTKKK